MTSAADARPSFNCATTRTFRETAVCRDKQLAGLDRDIAGAYSRALARFDKADASALRKDQQDFLTSIDWGFEHLLAFSQGGEATEDELNAALKERDGPVAELKEELKRRLYFLKSLEPDRKTPIGEWANASSTQISVTQQDHTFIVGFDASSFGWTRYNCQFQARFTMSDGELKADAAKNLDIDRDYHNRLTLRQLGARLELRETEDENTFDGWTCPHRPQLQEVLFPVRSAHYAKKALN